MFWHGSLLSRVERLALSSFVANGHPVELHVYDPQPAVPRGICVADACQVLPRSALFQHRRTGSLGLFADWFRYRLLQSRGGIWADTDVVCLRPLDYQDPIVFGWENAQFVNTAVLGLPADHRLAAWMANGCENPNYFLPYDTIGQRAAKLARRYLLGNRRSNIRWGEYGPKGMTHAARHFNLLHHARPIEEFYPVPSHSWRSLFEPHQGQQDNARDFPENSRAVHLWHAMMHSDPGFDKNGAFSADSPFEKLCARYEVKIDV
jgi:Alpha 1,4-glycosyltransferase conserved region/Glycosyltransferase sugar-binding region containing DXD motif